MVSLSRHMTWIRNLNKLLHFIQEVYEKLKDKKTPSGFTIDGCIQTGVDNPGHPFIFTVGSYHVHSKLEGSLCYMQSSFTDNSNFEVRMSSW